MANRLTGSFLLFALCGPLMAAPFAYVPQPLSNRVSTFDLSTDTNRSETARKANQQPKIIELPTQANPVAATPNLSGTFVYVVNKDSNSITIINSSNNTVTGTVSVGNKPIAAAVSRDDKKLYVAHEGDNSLHILDTSNLKPLKTVQLNHRPTQLLISEGGWLYVMSTQGKTVQAFDSSTDTLLFTLNTDVLDEGAKKSAGAPLAITSWAEETLYVGAEDGDIYVWDISDPNKIAPQPRIQLKEKPFGTKRTIKAIDSYKTALYAALHDGDILLIGTSTPGADYQTTVSTNTTPTGLNISNDLRTLVVTNDKNNNLALIATADNSISYVDVGAASTATGKFISAPSFQMALAKHSQDEEQNTYTWNVIKLQVKRIGNISGSSATVHYQTESGTAFTKWDFLESTGDLEFLPGEETKEVTIQIIGDTTVEDYESFYLKLNNPGDGYNIGPQGNTEITLVNDDSLPTGAGCAIGSNDKLDPTLPMLAGAALAWLTLRQRRNTLRRR
ncbi:MAG: hypothetical protein EKK59_06795 [Neisseriaceae bacterium]|nr:MAG: hypothetical protein EKK59_06795 [Neisseriaceae bacterium]